ncbi:MAG: HAD-IC family P-type ATPase, partial [Verrucomicrobia bacterium]|nr:HAD-IC family P-type ATPase [Verrucomicrobiota bacterium]
MKTEAVLEALGSDGDGISSQQAETSRKLYGLNRLPEPKRTNPVLRFFKHFQNILIYTLLGSSAITAFLGHWTDTFVILAVVFVNAAIGFVQEGKAEKAMDAIRGMLANKASVIRDGVRQAIDSEWLVPGDIVLIEAGNKIPADLRLTQAHGLHIQESILTGESLPSEKHIQPVEVAAPTGDRKCMAYSGTIVTSGSGCGVVVGTGAKTEIGRISCMLSGVSTLTTPLVQQMNVFAKWLTILILLIAGVLLVFGYYVEHFEFSEVFMAVVGLSVAAIPEGLPAVLTITLAAGVQAMAKRRAIVRRLPAIETLGSVSVICSDKTGTLTRNEMMVVTAATGNREFSIEGNGYSPEGSIRLNGGIIRGDQFPDLWDLASLSIVCNDAALVHRDSDQVWLVEGDPMEGALLAFAAKTGMDPENRRAEWTRIDTIPFDSRHRFMATLNHDARHGLVQAAVKGAPEHILEKCQHQRCIDGSTSPIQTDFWRVMADELAAKGQRVLALAVKVLPRETRTISVSDIENGLVLVGLVGLVDPPRPEVIEAISECHRAGIRVKMITGDHRGTAAAIGRQIGLKNTQNVLTGVDLDTMDNLSLAQAVVETDIFARTSPEHKLRLVMALQSHGMTVAMTGDGVNDAPALKRADAGIAMGLKGSEAAKEAAEIVLADDNFASIVAAVREGRTVYDNIKKVISWTLPTNAGEALTLIVA